MPWTWSVSASAHIQVSSLHGNCHTTKVRRHTKTMAVCHQKNPFYLPSHVGFCCERFGSKELHASSQSTASRRRRRTVTRCSRRRKPTQQSPRTTVLPGPPELPATTRMISSTTLGALVACCPRRGPSLGHLARPRTRCDLGLVARRRSRSARPSVVEWSDCVDFSVLSSTWSPHSKCWHNGAFSHVRAVRWTFWVARGL